MPFVLVTTLFFLWGFAHSILDVLNKHFQDAFDKTKFESALVQAMVYGGYFLMALPAGAIIRRHGYRAGILSGLFLYGIGALLFIPCNIIGSFPFFLCALFVIGCGLTCLETAANPYVTVLGPTDSGERRINIAQSFNGLGWIIGPVIGGLCVLGENSNIAIPYATIGIIVLLIMLAFARTKLPEPEPTNTIDQACEISNGQTAKGALLRCRHFTFGLCALFLYVAAQTGINSFFINYTLEHTPLDKTEAALWLGGLGMGLFMIGRMGGSFAMKKIRPERLLMLCGIVATAAMAIVMIQGGTIGFYALFAALLCESIMFPTIFALAIRHLGLQTKTASSLLIMSIVGGALAPLAMGAIADHAGDTAHAFCIPMACFVCIALYGFVYRKLT